jgi:hypothetical protein
MYQPKRKAVFCKCTNHHHHAILTLQHWQDPKLGLTDLECCLDLHIAPHPSFLKRLRNAIRYVFTGRSDCYEEIMISEEDAEEMRDLLGEFVALNRALR